MARLWNRSRGSKAHPTPVSRTVGAPETGDLDKTVSLCKAVDIAWRDWGIALMICNE